MHSSAVVLVAICASLLALVEGQCGIEKCDVPVNVYHDLKCTPKYASTNDCCPKEFDCAHIYNKPAGTCHLRGKFYKEGQRPSEEDVASSCSHPLCECTKSQDFKCIVPSDSCAEFWVPEFTKPGCYLTHELNRCCSNGQKCPPFNDKVKCEVNGKTYKEGERFDHPHEKCTICVCNQGFAGKLDTRFCQRRNCTTELDYSKEIDNHCAPLYRDLNDCCPRSWVCPSANGIYIPRPTPPTNTTPQCKFGDRYMYVGEKYEGEKLDVVRVNKFSCECAVPPYLTCTSKV